MTKEEKTKILHIISQYGKCHEKIEKLEKEITNLLDKKNLLVSELNSIRNNEKEVVNELQKKYGNEAILNLEKMEITNG
jgi:hypothetical protein